MTKPDEGAASAGLDRPGDTARHRLVRVALEQFAANGFEATSTAQIARRAGVTQPLVHYHFESKEALWRAAVLSVFERASDRIDEFQRETERLPPREQLESGIRGMVEFSAAFPELGRIVAYEGARGGERLRWLLELGIAGAPNRFIALLRAGMDDGWLKPLPVEHVVISLAAAGGYFFVIRETLREAYEIDTTDADTVRRHADTLVELFLHGLLANDRDDVDVEPEPARA